MNSINFFNIISMLKTGGWVMLPIMLMAILSIVLIIDKLLFYFRNAKLPIALENMLTTEFKIDKVRSVIANNTIANKNLYRQFLLLLLNAVDDANNIKASNDNRLDYDRNKKLIEAKVGVYAQQIEKTYSSSLWIIDTFVTLAPLIGLFGTIIGMMDSFKIIGNGKINNPNAITAGVAQALVATAAGLIIAICDLFFLNFFNRNQEILLSNLESIANLTIEEAMQSDNATISKNNNHNNQ